MTSSLKESVFQAISDGHCAILCVNSNTATEELYSDDVCAGYEYNASSKTCKLGKTSTLLTATGITKKVMHKYVEPWLEPVTKSIVLIYTILIRPLNDKNMDYNVQNDRSSKLIFWLLTGMYSCDEANDCCGLVYRGYPYYRNMPPGADCCTDSNPCSVGEGGCQSDSNCKDDLICGADCNSEPGFEQSKGYF